MARFKKARKARRGFFAKKTRSKSSNSGTNILAVAGMAAAYGFGRPYIEKAIQPLSSKLPFGGYEDEILLGVAGYFAAKGKFGNNKMIKNAGMAVLIIEAARVGSGAGSQLIAAKSTTNNAYEY